jgi:predicted RNase H-like nuclease
MHPHAVTVSLFNLDRIVKYKRGTREQRARELRRLRMPVSAHLPSVPRTGNLKPTEDQIDAVLCAYVAAH